MEWGFAIPTQGRNRGETGNAPTCPFPATPGSGHKIRAVLARNSRTGSSAAVRTHIYDANPPLVGLLGLNLFDYGQDAWFSRRWSQQRKRARGASAYDPSADGGPQRSKRSSSRTSETFRELPGVHPARAHTRQSKTRKQKKKKSKAPLDAVRGLVAVCRREIARFCFGMRESQSRPQLDRLEDRA